MQSDVGVTVMDDEPWMFNSDFFDRNRKRKHFFYDDPNVKRDISYDLPENHMQESSCFGDSRYNDEGEINESRNEFSKNTSAKSRQNKRRNQRDFWRDNNSSRKKSRNTARRSNARCVDRNNNPQVERNFRVTIQNRNVEVDKETKRHIELSNSLDDYFTKRSKHDRTQSIGLGNVQRKRSKNTIQNDCSLYTDDLVYSVNTYGAGETETTVEPISFRDDEISGNETYDQIPSTFFQDCLSTFSRERPLNNEDSGLSRRDSDLSYADAYNSRTYKHMNNDNLVSQQYVENEPTLFGDLNSDIVRGTHYGDNRFTSYNDGSVDISYKQSEREYCKENISDRINRSYKNTYGRDIAAALDQPLLNLLGRLHTSGDLYEGENNEAVDGRRIRTAQIYNNRGSDRDLYRHTEHIRNEEVRSEPEHNYVDNDHILRSGERILDRQVGQQRDNRANNRDIYLPGECMHKPGFQQSVSCRDGNRDTHLSNERIHDKGIRVEQSGNYKGNDSDIHLSNERIHDRGIRVEQSDNYRGEDFDTHLSNERIDDREIRVEQSCNYRGNDSDIHFSNKRLHNRDSDIVIQYPNERLYGREMELLKGDDYRDNDLYISHPKELIHNNVASLEQIPAWRTRDHDICHQNKPSDNREIGSEQRQSYADDIYINYSSERVCDRDGGCEEKNRYRDNSCQNEYSENNRARLIEEGDMFSKQIESGKSRDDYEILRGHPSIPYNELLESEITKRYNEELSNVIHRHFNIVDKEGEQSWFSGNNKNKDYVEIVDLTVVDGGKQPNDNKEQESDSNEHSDRQGEAISDRQRDYISSEEPNSKRQRDSNIDRQRESTIKQRGSSSRTEKRYNDNSVHKSDSGYKHLSDNTATHRRVRRSRSRSFTRESKNRRRSISRSRSRGYKSSRKTTSRNVKKRSDIEQILLDAADESVNTLKKKQASFKQVILPITQQLAMSAIRYVRPVHYVQLPTHVIQGQMTPNAVIRQQIHVSQSRNISGKGISQGIQLPSNLLQRDTIVPQKDKTTTSSVNFPKTPLVKNNEVLVKTKGKVTTSVGSELQIPSSKNTVSVLPEPSVKLNKCQRLLHNAFRQIDAKKTEKPNILAKMQKERKKRIKKPWYTQHCQVLRRKRYKLVHRLRNARLAKDKLKVKYFKDQIRAINSEYVSLTRKLKSTYLDKLEKIGDTEGLVKDLVDTLIDKVVSYMKMESKGEGNAEDIINRHYHVKTISSKVVSSSKDANIPSSVDVIIVEDDDIESDASNSEVDCS